MYPQEWTSGFPLIKYVALNKPLGCTIVMSFGGKVMIDGWI
jgi:hypothetical protein